MYRPGCIIRPRWNSLTVFTGAASSSGGLSYARRNLEDKSLRLLVLSVGVLWTVERRPVLCVVSRGIVGYVIEDHVEHDKCSL